MKHEVLHSPVFSTLRLDFASGESVFAQPGSMQAMTPGFQIDVKAGLHMQGPKSGIGRGLRSWFGGESFFTVIYKAKREGQHLMLAPEQMGDIRALEIDENSQLLLARGAFLACTPEVYFTLHNAGMQGLLATHGLFFLKTEGRGTLFLCSYGGIIEEVLAPEERFVLDNRNIVAFTKGMPYESVVLTQSLKTGYFSGEGFVVRFTGPGRVLYQTRARPSTGMLRGLFQMVT